MEATKEQIELEEVLGTQTDSAGYQGVVTISILDKKQVVSTKKYHNKGTNKLFKFLADCLSGRWEEVQQLRPCKIILFNAGTREDGTKVKIGTFDSQSWTKNEQASVAVMYDSAVAPMKRTTTTGDTYYSTTFHFRVPFIYINNNAKICKLGLYPNYISDYCEDLCAYFFITKEVTDTGELAWDPIEVPTNAGNFTVIIDWELIISDKNTKID